MTIKAASFKVVGSDGDWKEVRSELMELAETLKRAVNLIWASWIRWHDLQGSAGALAAWRAETVAWHEARHAWERAVTEWKEAPRKGRGRKPPKPKTPRPKCPIYAVDKGCSKAIYRALHDAFPEVHGRILELQRQLTQKAIAKLKPFRGSLPGWIRVILLEDRPAFSSKPQPVPFDLKHCWLIAPQKKSEPWKLLIRYRRLADGKSLARVLHLDTKTRRGRKQAIILQRISSGEYAFKGAKLAWSQSERQWYVKPAYEFASAEPLETDPKKIGYLQPAADRPWQLWIDDYPWFVGGRTGRHVRHVRRQLLTQRWGRQEAYRVASSAGKGHGKKRAYDQKMNVLRRRWLDFVKTMNEAMVTDVLARCGQFGVGRVVYMQPVGKKRERRFLGRAGKVPGKRDATSWDWYQAGKILQEKCREAGVAVEVRKYGVE